MGYSCRLKSDKNILEKDIDDIVRSLPDSLSNPIGNSKQVWGWSCGCDIYTPKDTELTIGGSYSISGNIAEEFASYICSELNSKGYNINMKWNW